MLEKVKKYGLLLLACMLLYIVSYIFYLDWQSSHRRLTFAMLDVGQGDALYIESPTGTQILVDAGPPRKIISALSRVMSPFDRSLDAIIITNPDQDHIGGFADVLGTYKVGYVLEPGTINDSKTYQTLREKIQKDNIPNFLAKKGMVIYLGGGAVIEILFPDQDVSNWDTNTGSVVAKLTYGETSVMLTGDATTDTEKMVLAENSIEHLDIDILKVGHHGSRTSTGDGFVKATTPMYALISDGKGNKYGHPHKEVLDTLGQFKAKVLRTDLLGTIIFSCARMGPCEIN